MKEVDPNSGSATDSSANANPQNGKLAKDLKGLVYQGGSLDDASAIDPSANPTTESKDPNAKLDTKSIKDYDIMNFSENEGSNKRIIIGVIAVIIIVGLVYFLLSTKGFSLTGSTTIPLASSSTTVTTTSGTTSTIIPTNLLIDIQNVDLLYNYTGPSKIGNYSCGPVTRSTIDTTSYVTNSLQILRYTLPTIVSGRCNLYVNKILVLTPGFKVVSTVPTLPLFLPPNSTAAIIVRFSAPPSNFTGPLSVTVDLN